MGAGIVSYRSASKSSGQLCGELKVAEHCSGKSPLHTLQRLSRVVDMAPPVRIRLLLSVEGAVEGACTGGNLFKPRSFDARLVLQRAKRNEGFLRNQPKTP